VCLKFLRVGQLRKNGGRSSRFYPPIKNMKIERVIMIIECKVSIKNILEQEKEFTWPRPESCPKCGDTVIWGHGFVLCYFSFLASGIFLKRYRCPCCGCIIKMKPSGFFKQVRTPIKMIKIFLEKRIKNNKYLRGIPRNTQHHWFVNLKRNIEACLGEIYKNRLLDGFQRLIDMNVIPVSCLVRGLDSVG